MGAAAAAVNNDLSSVDPLDVGGEQNKQDLLSAFAAGAIIRMAMKSSVKIAGTTPLQAILACQLVAAFYLSAQPELLDKVKELQPFLKYMGVALTRMSEESFDTTETASDDPEDPIMKGIVVGSKFDLGEVSISDMVQENINPTRVMVALGTYATGNWGGGLTDEERANNDKNVESGEGTIFAIYTADPEKQVGDPDNLFYIITNREDGRASTKVIMAKEY